MRSINSILLLLLMSKVHPDGLEDRGGVGEAKRPRRNKAFVSGVSTSELTYTTEYFHLRLIRTIKVN